MKNHTVALIFAAAVTALLVGRAANATSTYYAINPNARAVLNQMQSAYSALRSLSEQIVAEESSDVPHRLIVHTTLKLKRPGDVFMQSDSLSSRSGATAVVADGSYCYVTAPQYPTRYLKFPVPPDGEAFQDALSEGILSSITLALFSDEMTIKRLFPDENLATLQLAKPIRLDGQLVDIVVISDRNGVTLTFAIGQKDHLLRRITVVSPEKPGTFTETYTAVVANPVLAQSSFSFAPPPHLDAYLASSFDEEQQTSATEP